MGYQYPTFRKSRFTGLGPVFCFPFCTNDTDQDPVQLLLISFGTPGPFRLPEEKSPSRNMRYQYARNFPFPARDPLCAASNDDRVVQ